MFVAGAVSGGAVYIAGRADRELAANVRQTLAIADGLYFAAFELVDDGGRQQGTVFAYQGEPAWIVLVVGRAHRRAVCRRAARPRRHDPRHDR